MEKQTANRHNVNHSFLTRETELHFSDQNYKLQIASIKKCDYLKQSSIDINMLFHENITQDE